MEQEQENDLRVNRRKHPKRRKQPDVRAQQPRRVRQAWLLVALACASASVGALIAGLATRAGSRHASPAAARPRNIIFMVSDGFGSAGITLARDALRRRSGNGSARLNLESFVSGLSETSSANSMVTDSAAGATAWSCAQKTNNLYVGVDTQDRPCGTLMEAAKAAG